MYGKNTEGIISALGSIITSAMNAMKVLANGTNYRNQSVNHIHTINIESMITDEAAPGGNEGLHRHKFEIVNRDSNEEFTTVKNDNDPDGDTELWEKEEEVSTHAAAIKSAPGMGGVARAMYVPTTQMNNSIGSPFVELNNLNSAIESYNEFAGGENIKYMGGKVSAIAMLGVVISLAVDAKQSVMSYHDFVERGSIYITAGRTPTIQWDNFANVDNDRKTDGNIYQSPITNEWGSE